MTIKEKIKKQAAHLVEEFAREQGVDPREVEGLGMWFELGCSWILNNLNGNQIEWQKGEPKEEGRYLITTIDGRITTEVMIKDDLNDKHFFKEYVKAWCKLSDIEPYREKEETK